MFLGILLLIANALLLLFNLNSADWQVSGFPLVSTMSSMFAIGWLSSFLVFRRGGRAQ